MKETVKTLRQKGWKVRVLHRRKYGYKHPKEKMDRSKTLLEKGGKTEVHLTSPDMTNSFGYARCSDLDNYNKKVGVAIALGRALKKFNDSKTRV